MTIGHEFKFDGTVKSIELSLLSGDVLTFSEKLGLGLEELRKYIGVIDKSFYECKIPENLIEKCFELFQSQVSGDAERCFTPGYQLTFEQDLTENIKVQICWECDLIKIIQVSGEPKWFAFDSTTKQSIELLTLLRKVVEHEI